MSNIYIQEPPTNGKVLLITSAGDIDIELWSKEAPKACRNFVQLCMEGYYDNTIFHRVVHDFIVQGGDPTGTGEGGESIYGNPFKDEFHSRLRFVRRGLVAMANAGKHDNGSQFFFTMGPTQELQNKHTIFGKVTGNTVYNLSKLQEVEVDENDQPRHPHKIKSTTILSNPFDDIIPRHSNKEKSDSLEKKSKSKSQSKATKNFKLLSFGEEAEEDEAETDLACKDMSVKSKSSHDLTDDPSLSSEVADVVKETDAVSHIVKNSKDDSDEDDSSDSEERRKMKTNIRDKLKGGKKKPEEEKKIAYDEEDSKTEALKKEAKRLRRELRGLDKEEQEAEKKDSSHSKKEPANDMVAAYMAEKEKYRNVKKDSKGKDREEMTLALLSKFQSKLSSAKVISGGYSDDEEEEDSKQKKDIDEEEDRDDASWMRHKLHFEDRKRKVLDANVSDVDRYEIYDPRNPMTKRRREMSKNSVKDPSVKQKL